MKISKQYLIAPTLLLGIVFTANAQTSTEETRATIEERRAEVQETVSERREEIQENIAERRASLSERLQERVTNLAANMSNRFDTVINRLQNIIDRVDSRITKLATDGRDTTEAETALERAQTALNQAKATMSDIDEQVAEVVGSSEPRTEWQNLKASYLLTKELIKTTHFELRTAISAMKNTPTEPEENEFEEEAEEENEED